MIKKENSLIQITLTPETNEKLAKIQKKMEKELGISLTKSKVIAILVAKYK